MTLLLVGGICFALGWIAGSLYAAHTFYAMIKDGYKLEEDKNGVVEWRDQ